jgi:hypothetical protein
MPELTIATDFWSHLADKEFEPEGTLDGKDSRQGLCFVVCNLTLGTSGMFVATCWHCSQLKSLHIVDQDANVFISK